MLEKSQHCVKRHCHKSDRCQVGEKGSPSTNNKQWLKCVGHFGKAPNKCRANQRQVLRFAGDFFVMKVLLVSKQKSFPNVIKKNKQTSDNLSAFRWRRLVEPTVLLKPQLSLAITTADSIHFRVSSSDYQIVKCGKRGNCATVAIYAHVHWQVALAGHRNSITSWATPMPFHAASD